MAISGDTVGLIFKLSADSKPAEAAITQFRSYVQTQIAGLQQNVSADFAQIGTSITALINPLTIAAAPIAGLEIWSLKAAKQASDLGDQIDDLRQSTGLTAQTLSALNVAAGQEEKTLSSLSAVLTRFNAAVSGAQSGNKQLQSIFHQLAVDLSQDNDTIFRQTVD